MTDNDDGWRDVRPVVLGVPWRAPDGGDPAALPPGERELLVEAYDLDEPFFRPLGGGIAFGESSPAAVRREFREETGEAVRVDDRLGVIENVFRLQGEPHHEVAVVYAVRFVDPGVYERERIVVRESDGSERTATWHRLVTLRDRPEPLYPAGVGALLAGETEHVLSGTVDADAADDGNG